MVHEKQNHGAHVHSETLENQKTWAHRPQNVNRFVYSLYAVCILLVVIDPLIHKHGPFKIEHIWWFYILCGLIASFSLTIVAKMLCIMLMKPEDYYDQ